MGGAIDNEYWRSFPPIPIQAVVSFSLNHLGNCHNIDLFYCFLRIFYQPRKSLIAKYKSNL